MVRKRFEDAIRQEVLETLVQEAFKEVMEREKLDVAAQPHVHDVKFDEGQPLTFELHLEVRPKIELARTEGFRDHAHRDAASTDETVARADRDAARPEGDLGAGRGAAAQGDMVTVLLATPETAGGEMPEGEPYSIVLGGGQAIAGRRGADHGARARRDEGARR